MRPIPGSGPAQGVSVTLLHPSDLQPDQAAAWMALCLAHEDYRSPLLMPDFAKLAAKGRPDARVALISDSQGLACVFAFYKRALGKAWPIGAPFCDYAALVMRADADLDLPEILALAGVSSFSTQSLLDPWDRFTNLRRAPVETHVIRLGGEDPAAYLESRRRAFAKRFKNFRRLEGRMLKDGHAPQLRWGALDTATKEALFSIKSSQFRQNGLVDIIQASRSGAILDGVAASPAGFQVSLWAGDRLVAGHFGPRQGEAFHPWIAAYDPAFSEYSPGNLFLMRAIAAMGEMGLTTYDLADGSDHYKKYFANAHRTIWTVEATVPGIAGACHGALHGALRAAGGPAAASPVNRLRRRLAHGAMCEAHLPARVSDITGAFLHRGLRAGGPPHETSAASD
ncbi:MAG: GNAT family N-acetyltransferase [Hyphomonas sp.]|nr:GNAT family N-acetyltransferase [Hyphomonas sp.]